MQLIYWFTGNASQNDTTASPIPPKVVNPLSNIFESRLKNDRYLERCSLKELNRLHAYLLKTNVHDGDPKLQKITSAIERKKSTVHPFSIACQTFEVMAEEEYRSLEKLKIKNQDNTKLYTWDLSLNEIKMIINERGEQLTEIALMSQADDELLADIAEKCQNLTSLRLIENNMITGVSTAGIASIEKMTKLTTLELHMGFFWDYTPKDIFNLLSQPHFQKNITTLNISVFDCSDSVFPAIVNYQKLKKLTLDSGEDYNLMPVLQSPSIQKTLTELNLYNVYKITDEVILALKAFAQLNHLELAPTEEVEGEKCWIVKSETFQDLLNQNQKTFKSLILGSKVLVDTQCMKTIMTLNNLETLKVDNCKKVEEGYDAFEGLKDMKQLSVLTLRNLGKKFEAFSSLDISRLGGLPLKELTLSFYPNNQIDLEGWEQFSHGEVITKTLKSLYLEGINTTDIQGAGYGFLSNLPLESLRLTKCGWINNDTIKSWIGSPLSKTLKRLELNRNALTSDAIDLLHYFSELSVLGLIENYGMIGSDAGEKLINNDSLKKNLQGLFLGDINMDLDIMLKLIQFDQLKILITACNTAITDKDNQIIENACPKHLMYFPDGIETNGRYESLLHMLNLCQK